MNVEFFFVNVKGNKKNLMCIKYLFLYVTWVLGCNCLKFLEAISVIMFV